MPREVIVVAVVIAYLALTIGIGLVSGRRNKNATQFMSARNSLGPLTVGFLMMSEFFGTGSFLGTPQAAFTKGIWASMAIISLSIAFVVYAFFIAPKYKDSGRYTISGVLQDKYGTGVRYAASVLMIFALLVDTVSNYTGGSAALQGILGVDIKMASVILAVAVALVVAGGGLRGMGFTNLVHIVVKYVALIIIGVVAWTLLRHDPRAQQRIPAQLYSVHAVGASQLVTWTIGNVGAVMATQYVMQSVSSLRGRRQALWASLIASAMLIPAGLLGAFIGLAARGLFPTIKSVNAVPAFFDTLGPITAGIVTAGIVAAALVSLSALVIGATTLIVKDFYDPLRGDRPTESVLPVRLVSVVLCLLPLPFVWFVPNILDVVFFSRGLRAAIGVIVIFMFYLPSIGRGKAAVIGLVASLIGETAWYALGDPFGVDNIYIGLALPILCMVIDGLVTGRRRITEPSLTPDNTLERA